MYLIFSWRIGCQRPENGFHLRVFTNTLAAIFIHVTVSWRIYTLVSETACFRVPMLKSIIKTFYFHHLCLSILTTWDLDGFILNLSLSYTCSCMHKRLFRMRQLYHECHVLSKWCCDIELWLRIYLSYVRSMLCRVWGTCPYLYARVLHMCNR